MDRGVMRVFFGEACSSFNVWWDGLSCVLLVSVAGRGEGTSFVTGCEWHLHVAAGIPRSSSLFGQGVPFLVPLCCS